MLFNKSKRVVALFAAMVLEMEMVPEADLAQTARYLRSMGIPATSIDRENETIKIEPDSYNQTMKQLIRIVPYLPDIYKLTWVAGDERATLYESSGAPKMFCARYFSGALSSFN